MTTGYEMRRAKGGLVIGVSREHFDYIDDDYMIFDNRVPEKKKTWETLM